MLEPNKNYIIRANNGTEIMFLKYRILDFKLIKSKN